MSLIAILAALGLEQWRAFRWRGSLERIFIRYTRFIERQFNAGSVRHGVMAVAAALLPPVLVATAVFEGLDHVSPLLGLVWNIVLLYLLMGFRHFSHAFTEIAAALKSGDVAAARRWLAGWRGGTTHDLSSGDVAKLAIERGLLDSYGQVFATLFWFMLLPGPAGAVLYRAASLLATQWRDNTPGEEVSALGAAFAQFGQPARRLLWLLDWVPVRLTALSFAIVGDFEDAIYCWRTQASEWIGQAGGLHAGILLASGAGALGVAIGGMLPTLGEPEFRPVMGMGEEASADVLPSTVALGWRTLILWLLLLLLLTLAYLAP